MIELIGAACVTWTAFELVRLSVGSAARPHRTPVSPSRPGPSVPPTPGGPRSRRYSAWDEGGRRIVVEDLGRRGGPRVH